MEATLARMDVLSSVRETFIVLLNDKYDAEPDLNAVEQRISVQATADFEESFEAAGMISKKVVADREDQLESEVSVSQDVTFIEEGSQIGELHDLLQGKQKENSYFHAACNEEKPVFAECLLEVSALRVEKAAGRKRIEKLTQRLAEILSASEGSLRRRGTPRTP